MAGGWPGGHHGTHVPDSPDSGEFGLRGLRARGDPRESREQLAVGSAPAPARARLGVADGAPRGVVRHARQHPPLVRRRGRAGRSADPDPRSAAGQEGGALRRAGPGLLRDHGGQVLLRRQHQVDALRAGARGLLFLAHTQLVLPQAMLLFAAGLWLLVRVQAPGVGLVRAIAARWRSSARRGILPSQGFLLPAVAVLAMELLGPKSWFGAQWMTVPLVLAADAVMAAASLVLVFRSRVWAATVAEAGLLVLGAYGILLAIFGPAMPGFMYGLAALGTPQQAFIDTGVQGAVLLGVGLWLAPRVMREYRGVPADLELAARAQQLTQRVQTLTQTRSDAVDTAVTELRRIERDLHDGAQARLVALGMSLQAAERLFATSPEAALALVTEAKESSSRALTELRDLVRGIYPPVLADRGGLLLGCRGAGER